MCARNAPPDHDLRARRAGLRSRRQSQRGQHNWAGGLGVLSGTAGRDGLSVQSGQQGYLCHLLRPKGSQRLRRDAFAATRRFQEDVLAARSARNP